MCFIEFIFSTYILFVFHENITFQSIFFFFIDLVFTYTSLNFYTCQCKGKNMKHNLYYFKNNINTLL